MNRVTFTVLGFVLFLFGFLGLILGFIGLSIQPLSFIDRMMGPLGSSMVKLLMMVGGMIMFYMSRMPEEE